MKSTILASDNSDRRGPVNPRAYVAKHLSGKHDQKTHAGGGSDKGDQERAQSVAREFGAAANNATTASERRSLREMEAGALAISTAPNRSRADANLTNMRGMQGYPQNIINGAAAAYAVRFPDADMG